MKLDGAGLDVVITGASRGIGLAIAQHLANSQNHLHLIASDLKSFETIREQLPNATFYGCDFLNPNAIATLADQINEKSDSIDVLINNCGVYHDSPFVDQSLDSIEQLIDVNVKAPILLTRYLIDRMQTANNPIIVNISSVQAYASTIGHAVYAATKSAVTAFSKTLRLELNRSGIRVTVVHPSGVNTWGAEDNTNLLLPINIGEIICLIVNQDKRVQIDELSVSAVG